jgi:6-phosphogluconate dehydrogenase
LQEVAVIGLSGEGERMARSLFASGLKLAGYDPDSATGVRFAETCAIQLCHTLKELISSISIPRKIWLMKEGGSCLTQLEPLLEAGDSVVNCVVTHYKDTVRSAKLLDERDIKVIDAGVSGNGAHYALMLGGEMSGIEKFKPCLEAISPGRWLHCGPCGSGHFVEQLRQHIEQSTAQILTQSLGAVKKSGSFAVDLPAMMQIWQRGGNAYQAEVQELVLGFLNEANVLQRIASNNAQDLASLHRQMTPALNLALALHYACSGASLFQQQIAAMLGAAEQQKSD